jgi:hypothetical protein
MKRTYLFLTGGLGNQLFQMAAALALGKNTKIEIDTESGNPRNGSHPVADFFSLGSHLEVIPSSAKKRSFSTKVGGYVLRSNIEPVRLEKLKLFRLLSIFAASMYFTILNWRPLVVKANSGVGYSPIRQSFYLSTYLIGYFQTYKWAEVPSVNELLKTLYVTNGSKQFEDLKYRIAREKPVIVHIRRGDYASEPDFGVLPSSYYRDGLRLLQLKGEEGKVWAFTDDREWAIEILQSDGLENFDIEIVDDSGLSTSEVFDLMRFGSAYVIANSSFSWWAAYLTRIDGALVVTPEPWFIGLPEPTELIPPNWLRIPYFESAD